MGFGGKSQAGEFFAHAKSSAPLYHGPAVVPAMQMSRKSILSIPRKNSAIQHGIRLIGPSLVRNETFVAIRYGFNGATASSEQVATWGQGSLNLRVSLA